MSQRDREGELAYINRLPPNLATYLSDCKAGASGGKEELALKPRLPHNQRTYPSDCKAGARKSRPPWGKVAGVSLTEGGTRLQI